MDLKFYLDIPIEESLKRRLKMENKFNNERYFRDILIPAHSEFVEPTRAYADVIVDVRSKSAEEVYQEVHARIEEELQENPHHESA
jgi:uridine kinase